MPDNLPIPDFRRDQIHREDLIALAKAVRSLQFWFSDNFVFKGVGRRYRHYDIFPAIVRDDGGSPGIPGPADGMTCYVDRASTTEGLTHTDVYAATKENQILLASNLANLKTGAGGNPFPGGGPMPPPGTVVQCIRFDSRGVAGKQYASLYVFAWCPPPLLATVSEAITSTGGKYNGTLGTVLSDNGAGVLDLSPLHTGASALVLNEAEQGLSNSQWVPAGTYGATYQGMSTESPPRPILLINVPNPYGTFVVTLTQTGGALGDKTTPSSWTYTVLDLNGATLGTGMSPQVARPNGTLAAASFGLGYYGVGGTFQLLTAFEIPGTGDCPSPG